MSGPGAASGAGSYPAWERQRAAPSRPLSARYRPLLLPDGVLFRLFSTSSPLHTRGGAPPALASLRRSLVPRLRLLCAEGEILALQSLCLALLHLADLPGHPSCLADAVRCFWLLSSDVAPGSVGWGPLAEGTLLPSPTIRSLRGKTERVVGSERVSRFPRC